jgi:glycosyltransferase involved in cell wall biosynthesis
MVITGVPHYPEWRRKPLAKAHKNGASNPRVYRFNHVVPSRPGAVGRMLYEASWLLSAGRSLPALACDVAIGVIPSLSGGVLASWASATRRVPFGVVFQDLIGPSARQSGYQGGSRVAGAASKVELAIARRAKRVGVISQAFAPYLEAGGVDQKRIHTVRNWAQPTKPTESREQVRSRMAWSADEFVCLHAGNMGQKQALDNVLDAAALLQKGGVRVVFAGDGNDRLHLVKRSQALGLNNVQFMEAQRPGKYEALLRACDVLLVNQRASVDEMALPSKLTSYFASGRPTVAAAAAGSATQREVAQARAGIVVEPGCPEKLADAILRIRGNPSLMAACAERGQAYAEARLSSEAALAEYDQFLTCLIGADPRGSASSPETLAAATTGRAEA